MRGPQIPNRPYQVGDSLPAVCSVAHVAWVLGVTVSAIHQLRRKGRLREFLLDSSLFGDRKARYSGRKLQQWASGEVPTAFGRRRGIA